MASVREDSWLTLHFSIFARQGAALVYRIQGGIVHAHPPDSTTLKLRALTESGDACLTRSNCAVVARASPSFPVTYRTNSSGTNQRPSSDKK